MHVPRDTVRVLLLLRPCVHQRTDDLNLQSVQPFGAQVAADLQHVPNVHVGDVTDHSAVDPHLARRVHPIENLQGGRVRKRSVSSRRQC